VLILLTPIGALAPGTAWGEWGSEELKAAIGYAPANLERLGGLWRSAMPGYATPGIGNALLGYLIAAVVGTALTVGVAFAVGVLLARRGEAQPPEALSATRHGGGGGRSLARKTADSIAGAVTEVLQNEELAGRPGLLQRLDPRIKLFILVLFAVTASLVHSVWVLIALSGVTMVLAAASRVGVGSFERKVWASAGLLAFLLAMPSAMQIFTPGPVVVPLGPFSLTEPGLMGAATLTTRVVAAAGFALLVMWTMRWSDLLKALSAMRLPDVVVATLAMTQKQILTLLRTVEQIHLARESRTLTRGGARANRVWVTERMAFVVRKSMKTADDVYDAMLSRGFTGAMPSLVRLRLRPRDWAWSVASVALCAAILYVDRVVGPR
jgi:energy-coupling factor transporter transmembrane protein EcfT